MKNFITTLLSIAFLSYFVVDAFNTSEQTYVPVVERITKPTKGAKGALEYLHRLKANNEGVIPIFRGHLLNEIDLEIRKYILDLMCHFETSFIDNPKSKELILARLKFLGIIMDRLGLILRLTIKALVTS